MPSMRDYEFRLEPHQTLIEQLNSMIYLSHHNENTNDLTNEEPSETFLEEFIPVYRSSIPINWDAPLMYFQKSSVDAAPWKYSSINLRFKPKSIMRNE